MDGSKRDGEDGVSDVTREELRDLRDDLVERMTSGFTGVHERLDRLNGQTGQHAAVLSASEVRLTNLEREVFRRGRPGDGVRDEDRPALTRREWSLIWGLLAAIGGLALALAKILHVELVLP